MPLASVSMPPAPILISVGVDSAATAIPQSAVEASAAEAMRSLKRMSWLPEIWQRPDPARRSSRQNSTVPVIHAIARAAEPRRFYAGCSGDISAVTARARGEVMSERFLFAPFAGAASMLWSADCGAAAAPFSLTSSSFSDGGMLTRKNAADDPMRMCGGQNVSPALAWSNAPAKTRSFVVFMLDPEGLLGQGVSHWVGYDI